jgi:hypothetical protein
MADMFTTPPAGTPVEPNNGVRYYYRRQIHPSTTADKENFEANREVSWRFSASGQHAFVPQESNLVLKVKIQKSNDNFVANFQQVEKSIRYAADPVSRLFDQSRLSINGTTVANTPTNVQDISALQIRLEGTEAGGAACGSGGLLSMDQRMHHPETAGTGQGSSTYDYTGGGNAVNPMAVGLNAVTTAFVEVEKRNEKHSVLLDRDAGAAGIGSHEISTPLRQLVPFFAQNKAFLRNMEFDLRLVVSSTAELDALFSPIEGIPAQPRAQGLTVLQNAMGVTNAAGPIAGAAGISTNLFAAANPAAADDRTLVQLAPGIAPIEFEDNVRANKYRIFVEQIYLDAMFAASRTPLPPPVSMQVPYQDVSLYTRSLTDGTADFTEQFSSIPPSVTGLVFALRSNQHKFTTNRELYELGGGPQGFKDFQMQLGSLSLPQPAYVLDFEERSAQRSFQDYCSFIGGDKSNGVGAMSYSEWCKSPLICMRVLQNPQEYASTLTARFSLKAPGGFPAGTQAELLVVCLHSKVFEAEWGQGESNPSKVVVDEILS